MTKVTKVLVVSPEDLVPGLAKTVLGQSDVDYVVARDADAGCEAARAQRPQLAIVALGTREKSEEFLRRIRGDEQARSVHVLVSLASALPAEQLSLREAGATAVVAGSLDPFLWNQTLERLIESGRRRTASIPVRFWVWYRLSANEQPARGRALNVGVRGMLLETDQPVSVDHGTEVEVEFVLPDRDVALRLRGRVVREAEAGAAGQRRFGIEFLGLPSDDHDRIAAFVEAERDR
jgi:CheY-like chemotaxis protein